MAVNSTISIKNSKNSVVEGLTFLHNDIGSVLTNLGDLEVLIADLKPSVIALTGTWFKDNNDTKLYNLEGYHKLFASTRTKKRGGGGVAICYIRSGS